VLGDSQECHHDPDQDKGDSLRFLAHHFPSFFCFRLDTVCVPLSPAGDGGVPSNAAMMARSFGGVVGPAPASIRVGFKKRADARGAPAATRPGLTVRMTTATTTLTLTAGMKRYPRRRSTRPATKRRHARPALALSLRRDTLSEEEVDHRHSATDAGKRRE